MERVAMITGASSGLGRGLALALAREGWRVGLLARRREHLDGLAREIEGLGGRAASLPVDVTQREALHAALRAGEEALGPPRLLVANAGISGTLGPRVVDGQRMDRVLDVNLRGMIYAIEAVLPGMLERGEGQLVGVSSLAGVRGLPAASVYSASKAAMDTFLEGLRVDLRGSGVTVTVIRPGFVKTPLTENVSHAMPFLMELDDAVEAMMKAIRKKRRLAAFPLPLALIVRAGALLPAAWYEFIASRMVRVGGKGGER
jgi:short-subunit dehydrogenase